MKNKVVAIVCLLIGLFPFLSRAGWREGLLLAGVSSNLPNGSPYLIIWNLLMWLLMIFTILVVISFVVCGIMFMAAGTNEDLATKAKKGVGYSITGIVVGISGYIVIRLIDGLLMGWNWF